MSRAYSVVDIVMGAGALLDCRFAHKLIHTYCDLYLSPNAEDQVEKLPKRVVFLFYRESIPDLKIHSAKCFEIEIHLSTSMKTLSRKFSTMKLF